VCFAVAAFLVSFLVLIEFQNKIFGYRSSDQRKISSKRVTLMSLVFLLADVCDNDFFSLAYNF